MMDKGDDHHTYVKTTVRRVSVWFPMPETDTQNIVFSHISTPVEHLMKQLQAFAVGGSTLPELSQVRTSSLWQRLRTYASFVTSFLKTCETLWTHAMAGPDHRSACLARVLLGRTMYMSGLLWRNVAMRYSWFPHRLAGIAMPSMAAEMCAELYLLKPCRHDRCFFFCRSLDAWSTILRRCYRTRTCLLP